LFPGVRAIRAFVPELEDPDDQSDVKQIVERAGNKRSCNKGGHVVTGEDVRVAVDDGLKWFANHLKYNPIIF
jgi:hypothetical protein